MLCCYGVCRTRYHGYGCVLVSLWLKSPLAPSLMFGCRKEVCLKLIDKERNQSHIDTHRHTSTHTDTHTPTQTHTDTHRHTHRHTHTHTHTSTHTHTHSCTRDICLSSSSKGHNPALCQTHWQRYWHHCAHLCVCVSMTLPLMGKVVREYKIYNNSSSWSLLRFWISLFKVSFQPCCVSLWVCVYQLTYLLPY